MLNLFGTAEKVPFSAQLKYYPRKSHKIFMSHILLMHANKTLKDSNICSAINTQEK